MAKKNFYAVRRGLTPGIYKTWPECKTQTDGFPGAEYKGFETEAEAIEYLNGTNTSLPISETKSNYQPNIPVSTDNDTVTAYVDGSFDKNTKRYSYGCILFYKNKKLTSSKAYDDETMASMQNVAGEITGALAVMEWCIKNNLKTLHLYYDYEGIEKWCTGAWKTKNPNTIKYKEKYNRYITENKLTVIFHKVKSHSGNKYNEEVDKLAKQALGL